MRERLLLGDEAVAQGAIDAGIAGAFSYPGTPATEIFEYILYGAAAENRVSARWSANEKVAYEEALGMSYAGRRALVSMKFGSPLWIHFLLSRLSAGPTY